MDDDGYTAFMALHSHPVVESLAREANMSKREALDFFYNSGFYRVYERENTKLWHFGTVTLTDLLMQELTTGRIEFPVEG